MRSKKDKKKCVDYKKIKQYIKNSGRSEQQRKSRSITDRRQCEAEAEGEGGCKKDLQSGAWRFEKTT